MNNLSKNVFFTRTESHVNSMDNNSFIIKNKDNECYVIDPSFNANKLIDFIKKNNLIYKGTILTHLHFDHVYQIRKIINVFNENNVFISLNSKPEINDNNKILFFGFNFDKDEMNFIFVGDNTKIPNFDLNFILCPGHSESSMCIVYENFVFTGDHLFIYDIGRTDLKFSDSNKMQQSLLKIKNYLKDKEYKILPGHGEFHEWSFVKSNNFYLN